MADRAVQRSVARIDRPAFQRGLTDAHRVRPLVLPGQWAATDPFLLLMEDIFPTGVFDRHPHRGFETVTYIIEGTIEHFDNHGGSGTVAAGDALWLTAGRGLVHNEVPGGGADAHILQLWVNLPAASKLVPARLQELRSVEQPSSTNDGATLRVFSGSANGLASATLNYAPVLMVEVTLAANAKVQVDIPGGFNGFVAVIQGRGAVGSSGQHVDSGQVAWLSPDSGDGTVELATGTRGLKAILLAGAPLREPVAARGPFVMNTETELAAGLAEFRAQQERFGL